MEERSRRTGPLLLLYNYLPPESSASQSGSEASPGMKLSNNKSCVQAALPRMLLLCSTLILALLVSTSGCQGYALGPPPEAGVPVEGLMMGKRASEVAQYLSLPPIPGPDEIAAAYETALQIAHDRHATRPVGTNEDYLRSLASYFGGGK